MERVIFLNNIYILLGNWINLNIRNSFKYVEWNWTGRLWLNHLSKWIILITFPQMKKISDWTIAFEPKSKLNNSSFLFKKNSFSVFSELNYWHQWNLFTHFCVKNNSSLLGCFIKCGVVYEETLWSNTQLSQKIEEHWSNYTLESNIKIDWTRYGILFINFFIYNS